MNAQQTSRKTATFVMRRDAAGDGRVYKVDPPMSCRMWGDDDDGKHDDTTREKLR